eukprot:TRINITY_DN8108_c0_g1_i1.p1 TRINITY_DN8108_c0_g1~~TRINITY_DN8108_c0_g1_i1.p1  ORF type:complete len:301 (+),score=28.02 TRINITY_DN8108_c0_g1_i1:3-905(+)
MFLRHFVTRMAEQKKVDRADYKKVANYLKDCDAIVFMSGAGLGVDSGLPDFRGPQGFWRAYPPMEKLGLRFEMMSNPSWFERDPAFAWGFWSHRYNLYNKTTPHDGFQIMKRWAQSKGDGKYFSFTSNVDGHWERAGFPIDRIAECHGTVHYAQCADVCTAKIWPMSEVTVPAVNLDTFHTVNEEVPKCPHCNKSVVRPNVLMFGDDNWIADRTDAQEERFHQFTKSLDKQTTKLLIVEIGAGTAIPTIRMTSERLARNFKQSLLVRINPTDSDVPEGHVSLPVGALKALMKIDKKLAAL